jgi:hypothetical protein
MKRGPNQTVLALTATLGLATFAAACGTEPGQATEDEAAATAGSSIDSFDSTDTSAWKPFASSGSSIAKTRVADHASSSGASLQMTYTVASGGYAGLERLFSSPQNWSNQTAINLWVYGAGTGHKFLVQVYDAGRERWESRFTVDFTGWRNITLPFSAMTAASWQPSSATANHVQDFGGVTGMSLIPTEAAGSGVVTVDALVYGPGQTTTAAATTTTASSGGTTAAGLVGATGTNGTIIPLYSYPTNSAWTAVISAKQAHPAVPVIAIVNPSNGPGGAQDPSYTTGINKLVAAGVKVIGYVHTSYGSRPASQAQAEMDQWHSWYPGVSGIFFDEMANSPGYEAYYTSLGAYAKSHVGSFTVGNPGADTAKSYIGTLDVMLIYESGGLPATSAMTGWHTSYPRTNFGVIPYRVSSLDAAFVAAARPYVGYIYLQNDDMPNPWDTVPSYLSNLVAALQ